MLTPGGTSRSTATRVLPHGNQEEDDSVDEDRDIEEDFVDGDQVECKDLEVDEELGYIESEKRRRKKQSLETGARTRSRK